MNSRTPIGRLPNELLAVIFIYVLEYTPRYYDTTYHDSLRSLRLAQAAVCSRWWAVSIQTPQLWARIRWSCYLRSKPMAALQSDLDRSGAVPLDVELGIGHAFSSDIMEHLENHLRPHAHRIKRLSVFGNGALIPFFPLSFPTPALEVCVMEGTEGRGLLESLPESLRALKLVPHRPFNVSSPTPFQHLTNLRLLTIAPTSVVWQFLSGYPSLTHLYWEDNSNSNWDPQDSITFPALDTLYIHPPS